MSASCSNAVERLDDIEIEKELETVLRDFEGRHHDFEEELISHYRTAARVIGKSDEKLSRERMLLLGSYFTMEYTLEGAALFNPSIVPHPDQDGVTENELKFVMSLRAVGEGHLSSTVFQTGTIGADNRVSLDKPSAFANRTRAVPNPVYYKNMIGRKLHELGVNTDSTALILERLPDTFSLSELEGIVKLCRDEIKTAPQLEDSISALEWIIRANYRLKLSKDDQISDLIMFPRNNSESRGIEDMRLVRFVEDGSVTYYGTYTGFDGYRILPMMVETTDFRSLDIHTLNGAAVQNKGMALFPRKVNGHYMMCSRIDGRNLFLMTSDLLMFWETAELLAEPKYSWELSLMGNCGSPIETDEGWLLITHGVGAMRRYCIGAMLLDLDDPFRIRGRLKKPLIAPTEADRSGYVPNVVYSCGSLIHGDKLILPYAVADMATRIASISIGELMEQLLEDGP